MRSGAGSLCPCAGPTLTNSLTRRWRSALYFSRFCAVVSACATLAAPAITNKATSATPVCFAEAMRALMPALPVAT